MGKGEAMKSFRLIANIILAVVLFAVLISLVWIIIDERCSKDVSMAHTEAIMQEIL
jgi:hypothetical protein